MVDPELTKKLPPGIVTELERMLERDGHTEALDKALARLPYLLNIRPDVFERNYAELYKEMA